jgi:hypothetical protein
LDFPFSGFDQLALIHCVVNDYVVIDSRLAPARLPVVSVMLAEIVERIDVRAFLVRE